MKRINIYAGFLFTLLLIASCKDALNLEPVSQISSASFWTSEDDAKGALYGMYTDLRTEAQNGNLLYIGEARSETLTSSFSTGPRKYWENSLSASDPGPEWINLYKVVHDANLILKYVPDIHFSSEKNKNDILAQAHAMRAFIYFLLVKTWGDVPLLTEPTESYNPESIQQEKRNRGEIFAFIKQEIENAYNLFSDKTFPTGRNIWSLPAVNALKSDVYLWSAKRMGGGIADFETALNALNEIQGSDVQLLSDFESIFDYDNKGNKEVILGIQFQQLESGSNWGFMSYMHPSYMSPYFDDETVDAIGVMSGSPNMTISELVRNQFTDDDQRRNGTFYEMFITDPDTGEKSYYGSFQTKYSGFVQSGARLFLNDVIIYRYADVLLMKAEAKNALGQDPSPEINEIRARAYGSNFDSHAYENAGKEENDEAILKERLLEFTFEGKRWWDLIRFGKVFEKVPSLRERANEEYLLLFPIPESTLSLNSKIKQNEGY